MILDFSPEVCHQSFIHFSPKAVYFFLESLMLMILPYDLRFHGVVIMK